MSKKLLIPLLLLLVILLVAAGVWYFPGKTVALFQPAGLIANQMHGLFLFAVLLSLFGLVPIFTFAIYVAIKYRADNPKADYAPEVLYNKKVSLAWFAVTVAIIGVLGVASWKTTHQLDPYRPLDGGKTPVVIQVVALQWKWLFLYPDQQVATVNEVVFPANTPITFELTADAPMNSFWIPQLAGQVYAMEGMVTKLHLMADKPGIYEGATAEISGEGFASMRFKAKSVSEADFKTWVATTKTGADFLSLDNYTRLAKPSDKVDPKSYYGYQAGLYDTIIMKFMPEGGMGHPTDAMASPTPMSMDHMEMMEH